MKPLIQLGLAAAALLSAGAARADCKPLVDAVQKAAQQTRMAAYEVKNPEQALGPEPDVVWIGKMAYTRHGKEYEVGEMGRLWADFRKDFAARNPRCKAAGSGRLHGGAASRIIVERTDVSEEPSTIWIDQRTGLPVYEGTASDGGFFVVYGSAVKEPVVAKAQ